MYLFCKRIFLTFLLLLLAAGVCAAGEPTRDLNLDVKEFTLSNGMLFLIVERPTLPQVACRVAIRAGSALEETGKTGIAHMLEHMMFKGTKNFGTIDVKKDQELQCRIEAAYQVVLNEERKRNPDNALIKARLEEMDRLRLEVQKIYVPMAFSSQLARNGAVGVNAFTTKDQTQFVMSIPSDMLEQWFSIVSEQLFEPSWREFYVEKEVVQREWAYRYVNNPMGAAWLDLQAAAYMAHPYHNPTIGWKADMEKFNTRDAIEFHSKYYNPTNAVCVLVGDIEVKSAKELAEIYFGRYPAGKRAPEEVTQEPPQQGPRKSIRYLKGARTPLVWLGFHAARMNTDDFCALDAMTMVLGEGRGSRMAQDIINKGLAVQAWADNPDNRYAGMVMLGGSPNEPKGQKGKGLSDMDERQAYLKACEGLEEILLDEAKKLQTQLVSDREVERIKKLSQREFLDRMRSNEGLASTLATLEVEVGWRYLTTYLKKISEVTPEQIRDVARRYIRDDNKTSVYIIPGGIPDRPPEHYTEVRSLSTPAAAAVIKTDTSKNNSIYPTPDGWKHPLSFARTPRKIEFPKAEISKVDGATVFYLPDRELPLIDIVLLIKAGVVDVADAKMGLTSILNGTFVRGGTDKYTPSELALVLDEHAIRLSASVGEEATTVRISLMKEDWKEGLAILKEILTRPRFDPTVLNAVKEQILADLKREGGDAQTVCRREAMMWHFKGDPYGRDPLHGMKTIPTITRGDLKGFLNRYSVPSNMVVAVAGDIDNSSAIQGVRGLLNALPQRQAPERRLDEPAKTPPVMALINKPGQVQAQVRLILPSVKRNHPDYWNIRLLMDIFGGSDSLMFNRLRSDLGLAYVAGFVETYKWRAGMLVGYIGCRSDKTSQAIGETVKIMKALHQDIPKQDFQQKRLDALNGFVFNVDTPEKLVEVYGRYYLRKEPLDTLEKIQDVYMNAKRGGLRYLAGKFLDPEGLQIFVVGDKNTIVKKEKGAGVTLEEDLKVLAETIGLPFKEIALR